MDTPEDKRHFQVSTVDGFDRAYGQALGFSHTRESVVTSSGMLGVGGVTQYTVQTFRVPEAGDSVFIWINGPDGLQRVHLPAKVTNAIATQRDRLSTMSRKRGAKARAAADKKAGKVPGFMRNRVAK